MTVPVQRLTVPHRLEFAPHGYKVEIGFDPRARHAQCNRYRHGHPTSLFRGRLIPLVLAAVPIRDSLLVHENPIAMLLDDLIERDLDIGPDAGFRVGQAVFRILGLGAEREGS